MNDKNIYEKYSVSKLIAYFSIPAIISLIIEMLTVIVDTSFAGHLSVKSTDALSAMGLLSPLLSIFISMQTLYAISTAIMISKSLGENNKDNLNKSFKCGVVMTLIISVSTSLIIFLFKQNILNVLGAYGSVYDLADKYLNIALISNVVSSIGYALSSAIRALGYPKAESIIITLAVLVNIIFNAIFGFVLNMGLTGLALGTLVSEIVNVIICIIYFKRKKVHIENVKICKREFITISLDMFKIGFAQTFIQVLSGAIGFIINNRLMAFGDMIYISVWNIASKVYNFALMPIVGIAEGVQSLMAYYDGKGDNIHQKETTKKAIFCCIAYGIMSMFIVLLVGKYVVDIFTNNIDLIEKTLPIINIVFSTFSLVGIIYTVMTLLQVTGREMACITLSLMRQVVLFVPFIVILPRLFSKVNLFGIKPIDSIFFSIPIADVLSILIAIYLMKKKS